MNTRQRLRDRLQAYREKERAVSPVIGVILMVAITVILAAVIGAFVLGLGGQQESAPKATIGFQQNDAESITMFNKSPKPDGSGMHFGSPSHCRIKDKNDNSVENWVGDKEYTYTEVSIAHDGGDAMSQTDIRVKIEATNGTDVASDDVVAEGITFDPAPEVNDKCEDSSTNPSLRNSANIPDQAVDGPVFTKSVKWHPRTEEKIQVNSEAVVSHWLVPGYDNVSKGTDGVGTIATDNQLTGSPTSTNNLTRKNHQCLVNYDTNKTGNTDITIFGAGIFPNPGYEIDDNDQNMVNGSYNPNANICSLNERYNLQAVSDDINGDLTEDDKVKVVWSPPESEKTQVLGEHTVE